MEQTPPEEYPHEWVDRYGPQRYAPQAYPQPPSAADGRQQAMLALRCVVGVIGGCAVAFWALVVYAMLGSAFDTNPATDPHGYGIVFGVLISVPVSLFWALLLPFAAPRHWWGRAFAISLLAFLALNGLVFWALSVSGAG
ncbi:hypothetical protein VST63_10775 [Mycolicibacterium sp. 050232]|uniref:hypothetical protein n=1 Tax=Mycolicibacterium sp. 050232 TaxID=3113982 RepID=UPI002E29A744|nr:hypothetical protein [Mycolicibacterium sp. 050232]MED5812844.1 hypothetical protein [Mycolicibacterium sp. 050232]